MAERPLVAMTGASSGMGEATARPCLAPYDVRVAVLSPGIIETEAVNHVTDSRTLADHRASKAAIEGGIVADLVLSTYNLSQRVPLRGRTCRQASLDTLHPGSAMLARAAIGVRSAYRTNIRPPARDCPRVS